MPGLHADLTASVFPGQGLPAPTWPAEAGSMARSHGPAACGPRLHGPLVGPGPALCRRSGKQSRGRRQAGPAPPRPALPRPSGTLEEI